MWKILRAEEDTDRHPLSQSDVQISRKGPTNNYHKCVDSQLPKQQLLCFPKQYMCTVHKQTVKETVHLDDTVAKLISVERKLCLWF